MHALNIDIDIYIYVCIIYMNLCMKKKFDLENDEPIQIFYRGGVVCAPPHTEKLLFCKQCSTSYSLIKLSIHSRSVLAVQAHSSSPPKSNCACAAAQREKLAADGGGTAAEARASQFSR